MSEVWSKFIASCKACFGTAWTELKNVAKASWDVFKVAAIDFVKAVFVWVETLIEAVFKIAFEIIKVVGYDLLIAIKDTLAIVLNAIIAWIEKL